VSRTAQPVARWAQGVTWALSLVGLAISAYLTFTHFAGNQYLACSSTGVINCGVVTTSAQSYFLGMPVAVLGLAHYVVMSVLTSPWAWRARAYWVHVARFVLVVISMAFVLWLVAAELLIIDHICLWCTGVHIATFALFGVMVSVAPTQLGWVSGAGESVSPSR
jgi:uncharacterized membrane protein